MKVVASGRRRLTSSATARWSGPITTASEAPAPFGAASSTCASSDWPATGCRTFGIADCMRVPSPAASTIVRLVLPVIRILIVWWRRLRRGRHKAFSLPMETCSSRGKTPRIPDRSVIPVNVCRLIRLRPQEGRERPMAKDSDHLAGSFDTENTGGFLTGFLAVEAATARNSSPAAVPSVAQGTPNSPATPTAMPLMASKSILAPPDAAAGKMIKPETAANAVTASPMPEVVAPAASADDAERDPPWAASSKVAVQRTEFGVDVGGANSLGGLRALWRGLKSNTALAALRPIIVVKESTTGLGMQLRLVAGPLADAAAAAKICAALLESQRPCETTVFDGQRLAMKAEEPPASVKPVPRRRSIGKRAAVVEEPPQKPETTLSSLFTRR